MKFVVCDDNAQQRATYSSALNELAKKHDVSMEIEMYENGNELLFEAQDPGFSADVIFLDIRMPGIQGDDVAQMLRERGYMNEIVFLTVSKQHFLKGFDVGALHYIVKGETTPETFENIFLRAVKSVEEKERQYVLFSGGGESRNIPVSSIKYFEVYKKIVTVHYDNTSFEFFSNLDKLERQLSNYGFYRIHRSYLVALHQIEKITAKEVGLRNGVTLPISRKSYADIKAKLSGVTAN